MIIFFLLGEKNSCVNFIAAAVSHSSLVYLVFTSLSMIKIELKGKINCIRQTRRIFIIVSLNKKNLFLLMKKVVVVVVARGRLSHFFFFSLLSLLNF